MNSELKNKILSGTSKGGQLHAILACILGEDIPAPCYNGKAVITSDGFLIVNYTGRDGIPHPGAFAGKFSDLERNLDGLSDHLKLTTKERLRLVAAVGDWVSQDYRARAQA